MPQYLRINGERRKVATKEELLEFANKIRAAGGANILDALLPSFPNSSSQCLIANALNFSCTVDINSVTAKGSRWAMFFPENMTRAVARKIADAVDCTLGSDREYGRTAYWINLPTAIGNAAEAFDEGVAFQEYVV